MRIIVLLFFVSLFTNVALGQTKFSHKRVKKEAKVLAKKFDLDKGQMNKTALLLEDYYGYMREIDDIKAGNTKIYLEKKKVIRENMDASYRKLLNPAQQSILDQTIVERKQKIDQIMRKASKTDLVSDELYLRIADLY